MVLNLNLDFGSKNMEIIKVIKNLNSQSMTDFSKLGDNLFYVDAIGYL